MKLYKAKSDIVAEKENKFYLLPMEKWKSFINDDNLLKKVEKLLADFPARDASLISELHPPIDDSPELWACGVTYLRSKVGRQGESKAAGGPEVF